MAYIRLTRDEYRTIAALCRSLDLGNAGPQFVKRYLVASLAETFPHLAERVARLSPEQLHLLLNHLRRPTRLERPHGLGEREVLLVSQAAGPVLTHARFAHLLKRHIVRRMSEWHPHLATRVERLSLDQFAHLLREINQRAQGNH
ncbi:MAG TPA: hypothetical protein VFW33_09470 [Gemmataceae bacterium]|nr:hypothetical protein [Gemmataceae bacterium]